MAFTNAPHSAAVLRDLALASGGPSSLTESQFGHKMLKYTLSHMWTYIFPDPTSHRQWTILPETVLAHPMLKVP